MIPSLAGYEGLLLALGASSLSRLVRACSWGAVGSPLTTLPRSLFPRAVVRRYLTLPLRPHLPSFYIVGFPKCGTTSMCTYLKQHPCIDGLDGLPFHEILSK